MNQNVLLIIDDVHLEGRPPEMHIDFAKSINSKIESNLNSGKTPILICAGDISEKDLGIEWVKQFNCETIYVCGNHEFWNNDYYDVIDTIKKKTKSPGYEKIHFLHNDECVINGVRFVGATMWTELGQSWSWIKRNYILKHFLSMADFRKITAKKFYKNNQKVEQMRKLLLQNGVENEQIELLISNQLFNPLLQMEENQKSVDFIEDKIIEPFDGETVVVTHHLPIPNFWMEILEMNEHILSAPYINNKNVYQEYLKQKIPAEKDILMMGFYVNGAYQFFDHNFSPKVWVHGHFHKPVDGFVGTTRILSSPAGYMRQSENLMIKEVSLDKQLDDFIENSINLIKNYDWDKKVNEHLNSFTNVIQTYENLINEKNLKPEIFSPIMNLFKKQHDKNLKEIETFVSGILYNLIKQINKDVELSDHLYVTSYVSGFGKWALKNKIIGIELLNFIVNEHSFLNEAKFKKLNTKDSERFFHFSQWIAEINNITKQTVIFKDALINFLYEIQEDPKLEDNYINNIE